MSEPGASEPIRREPTESLLPIRADRFGEREAGHLLRRAGFGGTPDQVRLLAEWGPERAVDRMLDFESSRDAYPGVGADAFDGTIVREPTPEERRALRAARQRQDEAFIERYRMEVQRRQRADREQIRAMQRWWLARMIETPRPLEEKLTLFWHGHFASGYRTVRNSYHMFLQNQLFRSHAAGNFGDLMRGIIRDPAMLRYLDNNRNRADSPNENLARELMELFALGEGNYTELDIREGARALTGYTYHGNEFVFNRNAHDTGTKRILGRTGPFDGDGFVGAILARRACAEFVAHELYRFFVAGVPGPGDPARRATTRVIERLGRTLRRADYELRPVLRELFLSEHFYDPSVIGSQIKSPVQLVVEAARSLGAPVRDLAVATAALDRMGQTLFLPPDVDGWSGGRAWVNTSTLFARQNTLAYLLTGAMPGRAGAGGMGMADRMRNERDSRGGAGGSAFDPTLLVETLGAWPLGAAPGPDEIAPALLRFVLAVEPGAARVRVVREFLHEHGVGREGITGALVLVSAMPEYQLC